VASSYDRWPHGSQAQPAALPDRQPSQKRTRRPGRRPRPGNYPGRRAVIRQCAPGSAVHLKPGTRRQHRPSVAVRETVDGVTDRASGPDAVRYTSVDIATHRPAV